MGISVTVPLTSRGATEFKLPKFTCELTEVLLGIILVEYESALVIVNAQRELRTDGWDD